MFTGQWSPRRGVRREGKGESGALLRRGAGLVGNAALLPASPQGHLLLGLLLVLYSTGIGLPSGSGVSPDISYVNAVLVRAVKMEGKNVL